MHKYPSGAIEDEKTLLLGLLGKTLYGVHGLGSRSFLAVMTNIRNLNTKSGYRCIEYTDATNPNDTYETSCCLGDFNIGSHHNNHYIFHTREAADAYLVWAKVNTGNRKQHLGSFFM